MDGRVLQPDKHTRQSVAGLLTTLPGPGHHVPLDGDLGGNLVQPLPVSGKLGVPPVCDGVGRHEDGHHHHHSHQVTHPATDRQLSDPGLDQRSGR